MVEITEDNYQKPCDGKWEDEYTFSATANADYSFTVQWHKDCNGCLLPYDCIPEITQQISETFDIEPAEVHIKSDEINLYAN